MPYVKASEPHLLETYTPEVTKAYITSRLDSVPIILRLISYRLIASLCVCLNMCVCVCVCLCVCAHVIASVFVCVRKSGVRNCWSYATVGLRST